MLFIFRPSWPIKKRCAEKIQMISALHVIADIKDRHGSRYLVFNRSEIDRQLRLIEAKS